VLKPGPKLSTKIKPAVKPKTSPKAAIPAQSSAAAATAATTTALQNAIQLLASNPASLSPAQFQLLQANGYIASTLPYSSLNQVAPQGDNGAGLMADSQSALTPAVDSSIVPMSSLGSSIFGTDAVNGATTVFGVDWYWLAGLGVGAYLLFKKKGRKR
jgi:hypothetical protein